MVGDRFFIIRAVPAFAMTHHERGIESTHRGPPYEELAIGPEEVDVDLDEVDGDTVSSEVRFLAMDIQAENNPDDVDLLHSCSNFPQYVIANNKSNGSKIAYITDYSKSGIDVDAGETIVAYCEGLTQFNDHGTVQLSRLPIEGKRSGSGTYIRDASTFQIDINIDDGTAQVDINGTQATVCDERVSDLKLTYTETDTFGEEYEWDLQVSVVNYGSVKLIGRNSSRLVPLTDKRKAAFRHLAEQGDQATFTSNQLKRLPEIQAMEIRPPAQAESTAVNPVEKGWFS